MCGRYALTLPPEAVRQLFGTVNEQRFPPRYNIAPTQPIVVVRPGANGERRLDLVRWGFLPSWVKDPAEFPLLINARLESAADKPAFRNAMKRRRCLVPASGFYEWKAAGRGPKQPFLIRPAADGLVAFAGLFETWTGPDGEEVDTAAILTRDASPALADIHDRMPAVVPPEAFETWLDVANVGPADAVAALPPSPDGFFERAPISRRINAASNDDSSVQAPLAESDREVEPPKAAAPRRTGAPRGGQLDLLEPPRTEGLPEGSARSPSGRPIAARRRPRRSR